MDGRPTEKAELKDLLGAMKGQMPDDAKRRIQEAVSGATDVSSLARKKPIEPAPETPKADAETSTGMKRKAVSPDQGHQERGHSRTTQSKKTRIEEVLDDGS